MAEKADTYEIVGMDRYGSDMWHGCGYLEDRDEAIKMAQNLLDNGRLKGASVQGRAIDNPTPEGEAQVYRGVAEGYSPDGMWLNGKADWEAGEIDWRGHPLPEPIRKT